jgi:hypothetical protein
MRPGGLIVAYMFYIPFQRRTAFFQMSTGGYWILCGYAVYFIEFVGSAQNQTPDKFIPQQDYPVHSLSKFLVTHIDLHRLCKKISFNAVLAFQENSRVSVLFPCIIIHPPDLLAPLPLF